jgi:hypothetical protein
VWADLTRNKGVPCYSVDTLTDKGCAASECTHRFLVLSDTECTCYSYIQGHKEPKPKTKNRSFIWNSPKWKLQEIGNSWHLCYRLSNPFYLLFFHLFNSFVCWGTGIWTQGFTFAKQVLYSLSHTSSPLCFGYFGDGGGSSELSAQAGLKPWSFQSQPPK